MKHVHSQEKEQFKKLFKQDQIDRFEERFVVLDVFLQTENHVTSSELTRLLNERGHTLEQDFVKDTLNLMSKYAPKAS